MDRTCHVKDWFSVFKRLRILVMLAMLVALSIVFKLLQIPIGNSLRFSLENLPVLLAGFLFGPIAGAMTGMLADLVGCFYRGDTIIPLITVGMMSVGGVAGILKNTMFSKSTFPHILLSVLPAHVVGSMVIKSLALYWTFATPLPILLLRIPTYLITGTVESALIYIFYKKRVFDPLYGWNQRQTQ